jgi:hypothetical protein
MSEQNLRSIVVDFITDLTKVFPEYAFLWERWSTADDNEYERLHQHFLAVFPERFFDIMNSNSEIFSESSTANTMFLPDVDFKVLFNCEGVSENTKTSMWKYLQLLLFTVLGSMKDSSNFGDAMNMFESMDENDLQSKMQETMAGLGEFFEQAQNEAAAAAEEHQEEEEDATTSDKQKSKPFKLPKPEVLMEHMKTLMDGKLGKLAKELTEEFTEDLKDMFDESDQNKSVKDIMAQIMKDPKKIMSIMKKITDRLQKKMKSGDISQEELMKEVSGIAEKFKEMGGGEDIMKHFASGPFAKMFKNMAGNAAAAGTPLSKHSAMKERLRKKMEEKQLRIAQAQQVQVQAQQAQQAQPIVVKIGDEIQEKSGLRPPPAPMQSASALSEEELVKLFGNGMGGNKKKNKKRA